MLEVAYLIFWDVVKIGAAAVAIAVFIAFWFGGGGGRAGDIDSSRQR